MPPVCSVLKTKCNQWHHMRLRIDHREPTTLKALFAGSAFVEFANLPAGDFEFSLAANEDRAAVKLLIERKELADLAASIDDGRFDKQKVKLSSAAANESVAVAYLIEGDLDTTNDERVLEKRAAIDTALLTTPFRDGFFLLRSKSITDTHAIILRIADLYDRGKMEPLSTDELHRRFIASRVVNRSRSGGTAVAQQQDWWIISLAQIPGIGPQAACAIAAVYRTAGDLIAAYIALPLDERAAMLKNIQGGSRKIGPKASEKVWRTVCGVELDVSLKTETKSKARPNPTAAAKEECLFTNEEDE